VHSLTNNSDGFEIIENGLIGINGNGRIAFIGKDHKKLCLEHSVKEENIVDLGKKYVDIRILESIDFIVFGWKKIEIVISWDKTFVGYWFSQPSYSSILSWEWTAFSSLISLP